MNNLKKKRENKKICFRNLNLFKPVWEDPPLDPVLLRNCLNRHGFFVLRAKVNTVVLLFM